MTDKEKSAESPKGLGHSASVLNAGFTPGPWHDRNEAGFGSMGPYRGISAACTNSFGSHYRAVAHVVGWDEPETLANARLIAAAPDLAEALEKLLEVSVSPLHRPATKREAEKQARAALAKVDPKVAVQEDLE